jgi:multiple antibiotic resistance protein
MGGTQTFGQKITILVSIVLTFVLSLYIFLFSRSIHRFIGYNGMLVFSRLMGLMLAAIAVDLACMGIIDMFHLTT